MNRVEMFLKAIGYEKKGYVDLDKVLIGMKMYTRNIVCKHNSDIVYDKHTTNTLDGKYCRLKFEFEHDMCSGCNYIVYVKLSQLKFDRNLYERTGKIEFWVRGVFDYKRYDATNVEDKQITGMYVENVEV